ncbi:ShlB/FhaC/HecB family hemolysin secretion/activation protein [Phyllobacterium phragmitis]|uniref:ShlB/FhaC/HecB family hemolysin secretion/activation protein n=1 Tax=Phyllobacterium phragmitis TaxID=2670329 RepID=A0A2S9IIT5_9HYPH|nr:ShlB/FhaC/HecB family hemolysin secretion/activation protein [Phyllobacterium phragmitis]PRD40443.1 ShlB/FhaC/HecB family hemolysin secretion/activation protein [Phyllobacterium phragmitis]
MQCLRPAVPWLALSVSAILMGSAAFAQSPGPTPADDFIQRQEQEELQQRLEMLRETTPRGTPQAEQQRPEQAEGPGKGPCFEIRRVEVKGITLLPQMAIEPVLKPYENRCIGLADINALLKELTYLYVEEGYITSRVYVPEQNIAETKVLRLVAAEGALSDIYLNGKPAAYPGLIATAFPGMKGRPVNIRDVEQGLDQINRLSSNDAKTSMLPGKEPGTSILNVENQPGLPWHFSVANSNLGQKQTGYSRSSVSFQMDNLANLNDLLSLTYEHTGPDYPWPDDGIGRSNSISGSLSIPYGYWSFSLNGSWYKYHSAVPGNFGDIETSGDSGQFGINVDRVILRDKDSITTLNAGITYKETNNFLMGSRIEVGSREYTVANLGASHSRRWLGGLWVFDVSYSQGLGIFGAVERGEPGAGDADPQFSKFSGTVSVTRPFELSGQNLQFSGMINGQYSPDNLFGAEQISLGGYSNVRGVRDSVLFGNNGFFTRNEITWRTMPWADNAFLAKGLGELRPYVGLDYGHVFGEERYGIEGGDMAGWTVGARLAGGRIGADIGYSRIFEASAEAADKDIFFVSTSLRW